MESNGARRYYWLKLRRDFFKRHDIRVIEGMKNGTDYVLFYLKLLAESIDHEGRLRFSDTVPYDENMLATITGTNVDIVRGACTVFAKLGMMHRFDDDTLYMTKVAEMIGSETEWAVKKRQYRELEDARQVKKVSGQKKTMSDKSKRQSKSKREDNVSLSTEAEKEKKVVEKYGRTVADDYSGRYDDYCASKGKRYRSKWATIANWLRRDKAMPLAAPAGEDEVSRMLREANGG